ncbi:BTB/POZ domain-containing protein [Schistosoma japonicum]|uniref:BTB/POZ domain-containing protein n=1 Tax=Schistosoma japonicum TaxID=6182 RepID=A0A4Z2DEV0_SCHJA|nr:BTB/POZ domain-containing protein [Schistosoma japonicum]
MSLDDNDVVAVNPEVVLDPPSDQSISGRGRSHSTGSVSGPFDVVCDQESDPTHYRVAAKPCLVLRPSSSAGPRPTSANHAKFMDSGPFQRALCEVSSCCETDIACTSDVMASTNKIVYSKPKPSSFSSPPSTVQSSSSAALGARRRHSHIEFLDKRGSQSRSPPPSVDVIKAMNSNIANSSTNTCSGTNDLSNTDSIISPSNSPAPPLAQAVVAALRQHHSLLRSATNTSTASSSHFSPGYLSDENVDNEDDDDADDDDEQEEDEEDQVGVDSNIDGEYCDNDFHIRNQDCTIDLLTGECQQQSVEADGESGYGASCSSSSVKLNCNKRDKKRRRNRIQRRTTSIGTDTTDHLSVIDDPIDDRLFEAHNSRNVSPNLNGIATDWTKARSGVRSSSTRHKRNRVRILDSSIASAITTTTQNLQRHMSIDRPFTSVLSHNNIHQHYNLNDCEILSHLHSPISLDSSQPNSNQSSLCVSNRYYCCSQHTTTHGGTDFKCMYALTDIPSDLLDVNWVSFDPSVQDPSDERIDLSTTGQKDCHSINCNVATVKPPPSSSETISTVPVSNLQSSSYQLSIKDYPSIKITETVPIDVNSDNNESRSNNIISDGNVHSVASDNPVIAVTASNSIKHAVCLNSSLTNASCYIRSDSFTHAPSIPCTYTYRTYDSNSNHNWTAIHPPSQLERLQSGRRSSTICGSQSVVPTTTVALNNVCHHRCSLSGQLCSHPVGFGNHYFCPNNSYNNNQPLSTCPLVHKYSHQHHHHHPNNTVHSIANCDSPPESCSSSAKLHYHSDHGSFHRHNGIVINPINVGREFYDDSGLDFILSSPLQTKLSHSRNGIDGRHSLNSYVNQPYMQSINMEQRRNSLSALPFCEVNLASPVNASRQSSNGRQRVSLLVDGVRFLIDAELLQAHPNTMLGRMFSSQFLETRYLYDNLSTNYPQSTSIESSPPSDRKSQSTTLSSSSTIHHNFQAHPPDIPIAQDSNISAQVFRTILDYYLIGRMSCPPGVSVQELKEACDYFLIPFNQQTVRCENLRAFLHELSNDGAHGIFGQFLETHILSLLVKCTQLGERECHIVIVTDDETIDWDPDYPPQMSENELNSHIIYSTQMFRFLKYIENREVAKHVLLERSLKKIRIGIEGYPTCKDRVKFRPGARPEAIYNYVQCPFLRMSWEEEENKSRHVDFQCVKSKSVSDLTTGLEQAVVDPLPPHLVHSNLNNQLRTSVPDTVATTSLNFETQTSITVATALNHDLASVTSNEIIGPIEETCTNHNNDGNAIYLNHISLSNLSVLTSELGSNSDEPDSATPLYNASESQYDPVSPTSST